MKNGTGNRDFAQAVLRGLSADQRSIPSKYLYDERGSALFERICELEEYYLTRTETALLRRHAPDIAALAGPKARLIDFGSGNSAKIRILLAALERPAAYLPVDISREYLARAAEAMARDHPGLDVLPVCADFAEEFALPPTEGEGRLIGFFPGSTIGNLPPSDAIAFLQRCARLIAPDGGLLVGVDLRKDAGRLVAAYDDAQGVTAAFSLNLLARINRELEGDFDLGAFDHQARWNDRESRIEIHIRSRANQTVHVCGHSFLFRKGDLIQTEYAYKYAIEDFHWLARRASLIPAATWTDDESLFSLHYLMPV